MKAVGQNHGDQKARSIQRVRVRRDRRPSVICVVATDSLPSPRRSTMGRNGLGIAPAGGERSGHLSASSRTQGAQKTRKLRVAAGLLDGRAETGWRRRNARGATIGVAKPCKRFGRRSAARRYVGSRRRMGMDLPHWVPCGFQNPLAEGLRKKSAVLLFRPRHGAEGNNKKQERSKQ